MNHHIIVIIITVIAITAVLVLPLLCYHVLFLFLSCISHISSYLAI